MNTSRVNTIIARVLLVLRCFYFFIFRGKANKKRKFVRGVVIIQNAKLGDMVCTTPMFRAIKKKYPACKVFVVGNKTNKELLKHNRDVDEYLEWGGITPLVRRLKKEKVDLGCVTGPDLEGLVALFLANVPLITAPKIKNGRSPYETKVYRLVCCLCVTREHRMGFYAPREYLKLLEPVDIFSNDTTKHLGFASFDEEKVEKLFKTKPDGLIIGIAPGAGNKIKEWPAERFNAVAKKLIQSRNATIVVIGGSADVGLGKTVLEGLPGDKVLDTTGKLSIGELKVLIRHLDLFVSVDTGPIYIAEAFGIPTVDITGPIDEREQPPRGPIHRNVTPPDRLKPELFVLNARSYNREEALRQVLSIAVAAVIAEIDILIKGCYNRHRN